MKRLLIVGCFMYTCLSVAYTFILKGTYKIYLIPITFVFCSVFWFMAKTIFADWANARKKMKRIVRAKEKTNEYDYSNYVEFVEPYYKKGKSLYNKMLKGGYLKGRELKLVYELVFDELGESYTYYNDYEFKSISHKTYVLMKDKNITKEGWERIIRYLEAIKEQREKEDFVPRHLLK